MEFAPLWYNINQSVSSILPDLLFSKALRQNPPVIISIVSG